MSIATPLTASNDISRVSPPSINKNQEEPSLALNFGVFKDDVLELSQQAIEKQKNETAQKTEAKIDEIANEVVRVSSTIGRARTSGNLTAEQAAALYKKIASLM